jgi:hypothetical protein
MKKLSLILVLLLAVGLAAFAGEPSLSGTFSSQITFDDEATGNLGRLRVNVTVPVGDFVTVTLDMRNDNDRNDLVDAAYTATEQKYGVTGLEFNQVFAVTDISGIFGISDMVGLTLTMGSYECWMSNWNSATSTNRARTVETWAVGGVDTAPDLGLDIGIGSYGTILTYLQTYEASDEIAFKFGFKLGDVLEGLNAILSYTGGKKSSGADVSYFKADAGYTFGFGDGMSLYIPVAFLANLEDEQTFIDFGAKFTGFGLSAGVGAEMNNTPASGDMTFLVLDAQFAYAIMDTGLSVYINMMGDPADLADGGANDDFISSLDFGLSYDLAGNMVYVGYVADLADAGTETMLMMDDSYDRHGVKGSGMYVASYINF